MRIGYASDIHIERFLTLNEITEYLTALKPQEPLDVLVLAGDIWNIVESRSVATAIRIFKTFARHIVYVDGNHEWFGTSSGLDRSVQLRSLQAQGLNVLSRFTSPEVTLEGQHFCGTLFWYPCNAKTKLAVETWADNRGIDSFKKFWPGEYEIEKKILDRVVTPASIVVTHCLPCWEVIHPKWAMNPDNHFFVAPAIDIIQWNQPRAWIFGHTHEPHEPMTLFKTELLSNPLGYPNIDYHRNREIKVFEV